jgi:hypothetical protein
LKNRYKIRLHDKEGEKVISIDCFLLKSPRDYIAKYRGRLTHKKNRFQVKTKD